MSSRSIARARAASSSRARASAPTLDGYRLALIAIVVVGIGLVSFARAYRIGHKAVDAPEAPVTVPVTTVETSVTSNP